MYPLVVVVLCRLCQRLSRSINLGKIVYYTPQSANNLLDKLKKKKIVTLVSFVLLSQPHVHVGRGI